MSHDPESQNHDRQLVKEEPLDELKKASKDKKRKRDRDKPLPAESSPRKARKPSVNSRSVDAGADTLENSPFCTLTSSAYVSLPPISQKQPLEGICTEHLSPLVLSYHPPFKGVVLSYHNPRLSNKPADDGDHDPEEPVFAKSVDEYAVSYLWVTAEFVLFRPRPGTVVEGVINLQSESHIGLVCWNLFNASIERKRLPSGWSWAGRSKGPRKGGKKSLRLGRDTEIGAEGETFVDEDGTPIEGSLRFWIKEIDPTQYSDKNSSFISIIGTLLPPEVEQGLMEREQTERLERRRNRLGAGRGPEVRGNDPMDGNNLESVATKKHRIKG